MPSTSIESALIAYLSTQTAIVADVGPRIAGGLLPEGDVLPALTITRGKFQNTYSMEGESNTAGALLNLNCWGSDYKSAKHLAENIRETLDAALAAADDGPVFWGALSVEAFFIEDMDDEVLASPELTALQRFGVRLPVIVFYEQSTVLT